MGFFLQYGGWDFACIAFSLHTLHIFLLDKPSISMLFCCRSTASFISTNVCSGTHSIDPCQGQLLLCGNEGQFFHLETWENLAIAAISQLSLHSLLFLFLSILYSRGKVAWTFILSFKHIGNCKAQRHGPPELPVPVLSTDGPWFGPDHSKMSKHQ